MNRLLEAVITKSRIVLSTLVFLLAAGAIAYVQIPKESEPEVKMPFVFINVMLDGVSPVDSERLLVRPLEEQLKNLEGVFEMTAKAFQGGASVTLEFEPNINIDFALQEVRNKVDMARPEMPSEMEEPSVSEIDISAFPMMVVALSGNLQERTLLQYAQDLREEVKLIPGVLDATVTGARDEIVEIVIDPTKVESYQLNTDDLANVFSRGNRLVPAGKLDTGQGAFSISVPGLFETATDIFDMPVKATRDAVVRVKDIADIRRTFKDPDAFVRVNGQKAISVEITKRGGANSLSTSESVIALLEREKVNWPGGLTVSITQDRSKNVREQIGGLQNSVVLAVFLVMAAVVAALGLRSGLIVGVAIPGSFLTGILFLNLMGYTINNVVMFGLILSVGILVDGALVVVEYADRKMAEGFDRREAYVMAAQRMAWPIISSTATTIAAFIPLLLWPGFMGQMMGYMPITLICVLCGSLVMALIFVPSLGGLVGRPSESDSEMMQALRGGEKTDYSKLRGPTKTYVRVLSTALDHPAKVVTGTVLFLISVAVIYLATLSSPSFFPEGRAERANIVVHARGNLAVEEKDALMREVESSILAMSDFKDVYTKTGSQGNGADDVIGQITLIFGDWRTSRDPIVILNEIIETTNTIPGIQVAYAAERHGFRSSKPVEIELSSNIPTALNKATDDILNAMKDIGGFINVEDNRPLPGIEWKLEVDRAQAARFGADLSSVGSAVRLVTNGVRLGTFRPDDSEEEVDILVRFPAELRSLSQMDTLRIQTNKGKVPISNFVKRVPVQQDTELSRTDGRRIMNILADVRDEDPKTGEEIVPKAKVNELRAWMAENPIDPRVRVTFKGDEAESEANGNFLIVSFMIGMFLMGIILLIQFNSFYNVLLILSSVILSTMGVILGYLISGQTFNIVMSGIGLIALAGIVVNNNIVLIDTFDRLKKVSSSAKEAILHTGAQRLRPVFLTTITTVLGLVPMAYAFSIDFVTREISVGAPSTAWWQPLAMTIIFGLLFATILTLIVTPAALMIKARRQERKIQKQNKKQSISIGTQVPAE